MKVQNNQSSINENKQCLQKQDKINNISEPYQYSYKRASSSNYQNPYTKSSNNCNNYNIPQTDNQPKMYKANMNKRQTNQQKSNIEANQEIMIKNEISQLYAKLNLISSRNARIVTQPNKNQIDVQNKYTTKMYNQPSEVYVQEPNKLLQSQSKEYIITLLLEQNIKMKKNIQKCERLNKNYHVKLEENNKTKQQVNRLKQTIAEKQKQQSDVKNMLNKKDKTIKRQKLQLQQQRKCFKEQIQAISSKYQEKIEHLQKQNQSGKKQYENLVKIINQTVNNITKQGFIQTKKQSKKCKMLTESVNYIIDKVRNLKNTIQTSQNQKKQFFRKIKILAKCSCNNFNQLLRIFDCINKNNIFYQTFTSEVFELLQQAIINDKQCLKEISGSNQQMSPQFNKIKQIIKCMIAQQSQILLADRSEMIISNENENFIMKQLNNYFKPKNLTIKRCNILYKSKQAQELSKAVNERANTLLIVKVKVGQIYYNYACFSSTSHCEARDMPSRIGNLGLLLSTYKNKSLWLKQGKMPAEHNHNWLVYGNGVIKINKKGTKQMIVDFKNIQAYDNKDNLSSFDIFGWNTQMIQMQGFEIYEIQFNELKAVKVVPQIQSWYSVSQQRQQNKKNLNSSRSPSKNRENNSLRKQNQIQNKTIDILRQKLSKYQHYDDNQPRFKKGYQINTSRSSQNIFYEAEINMKKTIQLERVDQSQKFYGINQVNEHRKVQQARQQLSKLQKQMAEKQRKINQSNIELMANNQKLNKILQQIDMITKQNTRVSSQNEKLKQENSKQKQKRQSSLYKRNSYKTRYNV